MTKPRWTTAETRCRAHDLVPLELAALTVLRAVYDERAAFDAQARLHLDGLAYAIAELVPIYVYEESGRSLRRLSQADLAGALFQDGAKTISYLDGRSGTAQLAVNARDVPVVVRALRA